MTLLFHTSVKVDVGRQIKANADGECWRGKRHILIFEKY